MTPQLWAHRGASARALENTYAAFEAALADGADGVEIDVRLTRDGHAVVFHDPSLMRLARRADLIAELDWAELGEIALDGDHRIARLDRLLGDFPSLLVNIEVKPLGLRYAYPAVAAVAREVKRAGATDRVVVSSFDPVVVGLCRRTTRLRTGLLFHAEQGRVLRRAWLAPALAPHAVHPEHVLVDREAVARWRRRGYRIHTWTVDRPEDLRRMAALGVDAIICNDPAAARAVLSEHS